MNGLELSRKYYEEFGAEMIKKLFPQYEGIVACGLAGCGSECFGFDDDVSADHDFEPGFCLWIPEEDVIDSREAFKLERAYAGLPKEYGGFSKGLFSPAGGQRRGVMRVSEFLENRIGRKDAALSLADWFRVPEYALAEAVNGEVFRDDSGLITSVRETLSQMPEDVRLKKLAGSLFMMGQSGDYNYPRCLAHGERGAAQLAAVEFVKHAMHTVFLLNMEYMPYYKWSFKAMRRLGLLSELADDMEMLLTTDNSPELSERKRDTIGGISHEITETLKMLELTKQTCDDLGRHADSVNNMITDNNIRNENILAAI